MNFSHLLIADDLSRIRSRLFHIFILKKFMSGVIFYQFLNLFLIFFQIQLQSIILMLILFLILF